MALFPVKVFTRDNARVRWREGYKSRPLAEKSIGHPKGVYFGYLPSALGDVITLSLDPGRNASALKVASRVDPAGVDIITADPVVVDFTGVILADLPAYLFATADYSRTVDTTGQLETRTIPVIVGEFLTSAGPSPETVDLSSLSLATTPVRPSSLVINVNTVVFGLETITDDGRGNLVGANSLSSAGTIDYKTGALTGTTTVLVASSLLTADYEQGLLPTECLICVVDGTPGALTTSVAVPQDRDEPIARNSVPYGYMPAGSVETLSDAVDAVNEVIAARLDLDGTAQDTLSDRLAHDLSAAEMASRLGSVVRILRSNDHPAVSGVEDVNVSGSFSEVNRDHEPKITLEGNGSELQLGAITTVERNVSVVIDTGTRSRLTDATTRALVFGRLEGPETQVVAGTGLSFTQAAVTVTGDGTSFLTVIDPGDLLQGADGLFYEVLAVLTDTSLVLKDAYIGPTATESALERRRCTLKLRKVEAGVEVAFAPDTDIDVRFFFPAFVDHSTSSFDSAVFLHGPGEKVTLPEATTTAAGKIKLGEATSLVGSINIQEGGVDLGKFNILDFSSGSGQIDETAPGVVTVGEIGAQGGVGPVGPTGVTGPAGPPGPGFNAFNVNEFDSLQLIAAPGVAGVVTHTVDMGHEIHAIYGWWPFLSAQTGTDWNPAVDIVEITDISAAGSIGTVEMSFVSSARVEVILMLSSAGSV
jgi:hypothetical protein